MKHKCKHSGVTLPELITSMALLGMLAAAMGLTLYGGLFNLSENATTTDLTHSGRTILERMTREIRMAENVDCSSNTLIIYMPSTYDGPEEIYYILEDGVFKYQALNEGVLSTYVLLGADDNVTVQQFVATVTSELIDSQTKATMVSIQLGLESAGQSLTLNGSAAPRANQSY